MVPTFLITIREVIEATLIVATVIGVLRNLRLYRSVRTVLVAGLAALCVSLGLVAGESLIGLRFRPLLEHPATEGALSLFSALFVTWTVFFLHRQLSADRKHMESSVERAAKNGAIFLFTFFAVLREGIEIAFFLTTVYVSHAPQAIVTGFAGGVAGGLLVSAAFLRATVKLPISFAFRVTGYLLILFSAGLLMEGVNDLSEIGLVPHVASLGVAVYLTYVFIVHRKIYLGSR